MWSGIFNAIAVKLNRCKSSIAVTARTCALEWIILMLTWSHTMLKAGRLVNWSSMTRSITKRVVFFLRYIWCIALRWDRKLCLAFGLLRVKFTFQFGMVDFEGSSHFLKSISPKHRKLICGRNFFYLQRAWGRKQMTPWSIWVKVDQYWPRDAVVWRGVKYLKKSGTSFVYGPLCIKSRYRRI